MALKIYWTRFAESELEDIFRYYEIEVSASVAYNITEGIFEEALKLEWQPEMGQVEDLLRGNKEIFRYLIYKNYKIIYWINIEENRIEINDVFDTRQNPPKIRRTK